MDIGNACANIGNVLAAFLAPCDGCIVCGNHNSDRPLAELLMVAYSLDGSMCMAATNFLSLRAAMCYNCYCHVFCVVSS